MSTPTETGGHVRPAGTSGEPEDVEDVEDVESHGEPESAGESHGDAQSMSTPTT